LTQRDGGKVHLAHVPTCYKTTDFCDPTNKYVNFCRRNIQESIKGGSISNEEGAVFLLVNTHEKGPDTCTYEEANKKHCCAYVNGDKGVCRVSQFEEDGHGKDGDREHGRPNGNRPFHKSEDEEEEEEERIVNVDFGSHNQAKSTSSKSPVQQKQAAVVAEKDEDNELEKKSTINIARPRIGKNVIVKREEEDEEDEEDKPKKGKNEEEDEEEDKPKKIKNDEEDDDKKKRKVSVAITSPIEVRSEENKSDDAKSDKKKKDDDEEDEEDDKKRKDGSKSKPKKNKKDEDDEEDDEEDDDKKKKRSNIVPIKSVTPVVPSFPTIMKLVVPNK